MLHSKLEGCRSAGRPQLRWLDDVEADLRDLGVRNWKSRQWTEKNGKRALLTKFWPQRSSRTTLKYSNLGSPSHK